MPDKLVISSRVTTWSEIYESKADMVPYIVEQLLHQLDAHTRSNNLYPINDRVRISVEIIATNDPISGSVDIPDNLD